MAGFINVLSGLLFLFSLFSPDLVAAMSKGDTVVVATERLNLRSGPGTENRVVLEMLEGTELEIIQVEEGWARVELKRDPAVQGWTSARFLAVSAANPPTDAASFFDYVARQYGTPNGQGSIAELNVHYAYFCNNGFGLALFRASDPEPVLWENEGWCIKDLKTVDIDKDGTSEIVYLEGAGGTGTYAEKEVHVSWPQGQKRPTLGFEYRTFEHDSGFFGQFEIAYEKEISRQMQYGQNCRTDDYCPSWPPDAQCRAATICDIEQQGTFEVLEDPFPERLRSDPEWQSYVEDLAANNVALIGDDRPADLANVPSESGGADIDGTSPESADVARATNAGKPLPDYWVDLGWDDSRHRNWGASYIMHGEERFAGPFDHVFRKDPTDEASNENRQFVVGMCDTSDPKNNMWIRLVVGMTLETVKEWRGICLMGTHLQAIGVPVIHAVENIRDVRFDNNTKQTIGTYDNVYINLNSFTVQEQNTTYNAPICPLDPRLPSPGGPPMCNPD